MIKDSTKQFDENGNLVYYETDCGEFRRFEYDEDGRTIYYNEDDKYEDWREYVGDGNFVHLKDNQGNERYVRLGDHGEVRISKEEFDEKKFKEVSSPDRFRFELMEL